VIFNFGKHKSKTVEKVFKEEPAYYDWMMNGDSLWTQKKTDRDKTRRLEDRDEKNKPTGFGRWFLNPLKTSFGLLSSAIFHCYPAFRARY